MYTYIYTYSAYLKFSVIVLIQTSRVLSKEDQLSPYMCMFLCTQHCMNQLGERTNRSRIAIATDPSRDHDELAIANQPPRNSYQLALGSSLRDRDRAALAQLSRPFAQYSR